MNAAGLILFVCGRDDPDPAVAQVGAQLGQSVVRAWSASEALALARGTDFALVLVGYAGSADTLLETVRLMRDNPRSSHTPVVVLGLPPDPSFPLEPVYEAGAIAVLPEPVSPTILAAKARFYLDAYHTAAERRRAERALEQASERLETILAAANLAVWEWDIAADRVRGDARLAAMFGGAVPPDAPMAAYLAEIHPDDLAATRSSLQDSLRSGTGYDATFRVGAPGGRWRWIIARGQIAGDQDGIPQSVSGVVIDATRQFEAELELRASEERYRTLFEAMDEAMCVIEVLFDDAGQACDYRFIETNPAFNGQTGLQDAVGRRMRELAPEHEQHWFDIFGHVVATGEPARFVNEARALGRWFDLYATRIGEPDAHRVAVLFKDITERRRGEEELRRLAADLAEANRLKTEFLATLAHELRNPLAPIRSGLQLLRRTGPGAEPAASARVHAIMDRQLDQLVHLVDDLLDVARVTRGQVELRREWIDLGELLKTAADTSEPLIEAAGHRFSLRLPLQPVTLYGDPTRLTQVVSNLLNNAARYTPRGGVIELAAECRGAELAISVRDNGIGIPADSLERVFQMFTQVGGNGSLGGLGIGLSLVRSLVELHGGSVSAASPGPGAGSVFTVRLPLAAVQAEQAPQAGQPVDTSIPAPEALRILVVDDNRDAAETLAALLASMGHTTAIANDGYQALRMLPGFVPGVVFLDLGMPGMSGYEVAAEIRKDPRHDGLRLVALTGWGGPADRERSARAGFDLHLTKPATLETIEAALAPPAPHTAAAALTTPA